MTQDLHLEPPARRRAGRTAGDLPGEQAPSDERNQRVEALLDELTSQTPAEAIRFMRRWHAGPLSLIHLHVMTLLQEGAVPMRSLAERSASRRRPRPGSSTAWSSAASSSVDARTTTGA